MREYLNTGLEKLKNFQKAIDSMTNNLPNKQINTTIVPVSLS